MSSTRLYYTDAYLFEFDAVVRAAAREGDRWIVSLDRTAFYPTSGGQPFDTGTLGEAAVLDVFDREDGGIGHLVDRAMEPGAPVRGRIDRARRFDHMHQHTGQHLLSAAIERELGARTVGFHLGSTSATIDLDRDVTPADLAKAETAANEIVWEDREVGVRFVDAAEAAALPLRKEPSRTGELRIVEIDGYDLSACGGTHVRRTGAIGLIAVAGSERFKGGTRVEFVCGGRALGAYRRLKDAVAGSVRLLSVLPEELPSAIEKLQVAGRGQQKERDELLDRLAAYEADALRGKGTREGGVTLVAEVVSNRDAAGLKKLASEITASPGIVVVLATNASPSLVIVARSKDLTIDAGAVLKTLLDRFGGKGGGRGAMAQGGGLSGAPADILGAAREAVR